MDKPLQLCLHGRNDFGVTVPCVKYRNTGCEIDVPSAFHIPKFRVLRAADKYLRRDADAVRGRCIFATLEFKIACNGHGRESFS